MASKLGQSRAALPLAAVDDQVLGALGDRRVEVVVQHPPGGLLGQARQCSSDPVAARDDPRLGAG